MGPPEKVHRKECDKGLISNPGNMEQYPTSLYPPKWQVPSHVTAILGTYA